MSLYDDLGVPPSASPEDIRRAYRQHAKRVHPDTGGTTKGFHKLKHALDILSDPSCRARYDATGDDEEVTPNNTEAELLVLIGAHIDRIVQSSLQFSQSVTVDDMIVVLVRSLKEGKLQFEGQAKTIGRTLGVYKKLAGRFKAKNNTSSKLSAVVDGRIAQLKWTLDDVKKKGEMFDTAIALVENEEFEIDMKTKVAQEISFVTSQFGFDRMFGTGSR